MPDFALVDGNNFYVSCERVFQPKFEKRPVIVLSNNDGCVISRSNEAKALGIKMGQPHFQMKELIGRYGVEVLSSNYSLYGDMSRRMHDILAELSPASEEYSIDESFLQLDGIRNPEVHGRHIRQVVGQLTGIPVCVGIGPTKVLAKVANKIAKKHALHGGVFDWRKADAESCLAEIEPGDIWGVGPRYARMLAAHGVLNALQLMNLPDEWVRQHMTVTGLRVVHELRGVSCIPLEEIEPERKGMACTRSFGRAVTSLEELREAVASYISRAGEKLRRRNLAASHLQVFIRTNQFNVDAKYTGSASARLMPATSYTLALNEVAQSLLDRCYRQGFRYFKAGVILDGLIQAEKAQPDLFRVRDVGQEKRLMEALDTVNKRFGRGSLRLASAGFTQGWHMRRERLSPRSTTCWEELPWVKT